MNGVVLVKILYLEVSIEQAIERQEMRDVSTESTDGSFFNSDEDFMLLHQFLDQIPIERLAESCIGYCYGDSVLFEKIRRRHAVLHYGSESQNGNFAPLLQDSSLPNLQNSIN